MFTQTNQAIVFEELNPIPFQDSKVDEKENSSIQSHSLCFDQDQKNELEGELTSKHETVQQVHLRQNKIQEGDTKQPQNNDDYDILQENDHSGLSTLDVANDPTKINDQLLKGKQIIEIQNNQLTSHLTSKNTRNHQIQKQNAIETLYDKSRGNANFSEPYNEKINHKIIEKTQDKYDARNIGRNLFLEKDQQQNSGNKAIAKFEHDPVKEKVGMENSNDSRIHHSKLPPITLKKEVKGEINESTLVFEHNSSSLALQKFLSLDKDKQIENQPEEELDSFGLAMISVPEEKIIKCRFKRQTNCPDNFYNPSYSLFLRNQTFIINSKKQWGHINSHYHLSCQPRNYKKDSKQYAGLLKGNFSGTCFNLFCMKNQSLQLVATITYKSQIACSSSFRQIQVYVKSDKYSYDELEGSSSNMIDLKQLFEIGTNRTENKIIRLENKKPRWSEEHGCFAMNFKGKSRLPSVKNMILIPQGSLRHSLLLCKSNAHQFYMEVAHPLNPFIAFGVALTSFDFKLLCQ